MSLNLKSLASGRAWIAAAAICLAAAPSARAELTLTVTQSGTPNGQSTFTQTFTPGGNFTGSQSNGASGQQSFTFNGYTLAYTVSTTGTGTSQALTLTGTLTRVSGVDPTSSSFSFSLGSTLPNLFSTATSLNQATLNSTSTLSTTAVPSGTGAGIFSTADASSSSGNAPSVGSGTFAFSPGTAPTSSNSSTSPFGMNFSSYNLQTAGTFNFTTIPTSGSLTFSSTTQVFAVPEPASVVAGLMGLPCMGAALAFLRRRVTAVVA